MSYVPDQYDAKELNLFAHDGTHLQIAKIAGMYKVKSVDFDGKDAHVAFPKLMVGDADVAVKFADQDAKLAEETLARSNVDASLAASVAQERQERMIADSALSVDISDNFAALDEAIVLERNERKASDAAIDVKLADNFTALTSAIAQEKKERQAFDTILGSRVDFIVANTDPTSLDSLTEIVTKFNADGATYASRLTYLEGVVDRLTKGKPTAP